ANSSGYFEILERDSGVFKEGGLGLLIPKQVRQIASYLRTQAEEATGKAIRTGDIGSAKLEFLSAFYKAGGDPNNPSQEALSEASGVVDRLVGVSDPAKAAQALLPESGSQLALKSAFFALKSFAMKDSIQMWFGFKDVFA